mgnify:FL=1
MMFLFSSAILYATATLVGVQYLPLMILVVILGVDIMWWSLTKEKL